MKATKLILFTIILFMVSAIQAQDIEEKVQLLFKKSQQVLGDTRVFGIAIADVDLDGDNDIFLTNFIGPSKLWLNDGKGNFTESNQDFGNSEAHAVAIEDFNADGFPDIFLLNHAAPCKVFFNNGKGVFTDSGQSIGSIDENPGMIVCGDVDNDGDLDAFISYYQLPNRLWINNGKGFFSITNTKYGGEKGHSMVLADVNGDGFLDLYLCISDQADEIWLNDGKGNFTDSGQRLGNITGYESVDAGDINGDKYVDFVTGNSVDGIKIWLNQNGTGKFIESGPYFEPGYGICKLLNADDDSDLDLFIAGKSGTKLLINNGKGIYTTGQVFDETWVSRIAIGKLDSDNDFDIVLGKREGTGGNPIYFNESTGSSQTTSLSLKGSYLGQKPPGLTPEIFAPGIISTEKAWEAAISFSPDLNELFFSYRTPIEGMENRILHMKMVNNVWTKPEPASFGQDIMEFEAFITPDYKKVIYKSQRPNPNGTKKEGGIWYSERDNNKWGDAKYLSGPINKGWVMSVTSTLKGTLYFTGSYDAGYGIYRSKFINGEYSKPEYLPVEINKSKYFSASHPYIAPDESYLIFDADGTTNSDLFISYRRKDGSWTDAIRLDSNINTGSWEGIATVSPDGNYLFFNRDNDIYWVSSKFIEELKPKGK